MEMEYDPPPGHPASPPGQQRSTSFGWIVSLRLFIAIASF
jgi:hypothetical protein